MGKYDEELDELTRQLKEQLSELPDDGKEHELRVVIKGDNNGNIGGGVVVLPGKEEPTDPTMTRECPQCGKRAWRHTRNCWNCNLDLFHNDALLEAEAHKRRVMKITLGLGLVGLAAMFGGQYLPAPYGQWVSFAGGGLLFILLMATRGL